MPQLGQLIALGRAVFCPFEADCSSVEPISSSASDCKVTYKKTTKFTRNILQQIDSQLNDIFEIYKKITREQEDHG